MPRFQSSGRTPVFCKPVAKLPAVPIVRKKNFARHVIWWVVVIACGVSLNNYWTFYGGRPWIFRGPGSAWRKVNIESSGFLDISQSFRVHDLWASPFGPRHVCRIYDEGNYYAYEMHWSADGSVVALTVSFTPARDYGCAYDFRRHKALVSGRTSDLAYSPEFAASIRQLMEERGGVGKVEFVPDPQKESFRDYK